MSSRAENPTGSQQLAESESGETDPDATEQQQPETEEESEPKPLSLDTIFEILKNQRRRYVLQYLREAEGSSVQLNELADQVAAWENDKPVGLVSSNERKRVYVGLYQCHLTKMDESRVIDFDQYRGNVETRPEIQELYEYIDFGDETKDEPTRTATRFYPAVASIALVIGTIGLAVPAVSIGLHGYLLTAALAVTVLGVSIAEELPDRSVPIDGVSLGPDEDR
jgi:hypothetical protein